MQVHVYSGSSYSLASILDAYAYDTDEPSPGVPHASASISTTTANCQLVVFWSFYNTGNLPAENGTGFTQQTALSYAASFDRLVSSTGAYSENVNTPGAASCGNIILALKMDVPSLPGPPIAEIQSLTPSADLAFLVLDCSVLGGSTYYFSPEPNALGNSVVWQGVTYTTLPFEHEGFAWSTKGPLPRPKVRVAALDGLVGGLARSLQDLVGAKVTLKRVHARYLDAVNFPGGVNPSADPNAGHPDEPWIIERKTLEDNVSGIIEFELTTPPDNQNANIPGRRITANVCGWNDASVCSYSVNGLCAAGLPVGVQAKTLAACKVHWGATADLPLGCYPGTGRIR